MTASLPVISPAPVITPPPATFYTCPGETHAIPRSVHLARLGRTYAACRDCPHRHDTGLVGQAAQVRFSPPLRTASTPVGRQLTPGGVRGRYLNEFDRRTLSQLAHRFARVLWEQRPLRGKLNAAAQDDASTTPSTTARQAPLLVVVGYDERPHAPDLAIGAVTGLRHSGCQVVDIGRVTTAMWEFALHRLHADAGLLITGSGCDAGWTGCELRGATGLPLTDEQRRSVFDAAAPSASRQVRTASSVRTAAVLPDYQQHLARQFHALRPLRVQCVTASPLIGRLLEDVLSGLPGDTAVHVGGVWQREPMSDADWQRRRGADAAKFDLACWIAEDGQTCRFVDEAGRLAPQRALVRWLLSATQADPPDGTQPVTVEAAQAGSAVLSRRQFVERLCETGAACGRDEIDRFWQGGEPVVCDAVVTLAAVLRGLSWRDSGLAERVSEAA